ncbi:hypothetical protein [Aeromonas sobria]|uniref:hypothetical protein n=1 Tax=Aeromonas sobria TaxID=646 RepID=UPI003D03D3C9
MQVTSRTPEQPSKAGSYTYIRRDHTTALITKIAKGYKHTLTSIEECEAAIGVASSESNWVVVAAIGLHISTIWPSRLRGPLAHHDGLKQLQLFADAREVIDLAISNLGPGVLLIQRLITLHLQCCRPDQALAVFNEHPVAASDSVSLKSAVDAALKLKDFQSASRIIEMESFPDKDINHFKNRVSREKESWEKLVEEWNHTKRSESGTQDITSLLDEGKTDLAITGIWLLYRCGSCEVDFFDVATQILPTESERSERVVFFRTLAYRIFPGKLEYAFLYIRASFFSYQYEQAYAALVDNYLQIENSAYIKLKIRLEDLIGFKSESFTCTQISGGSSVEQAQLEAIRAANILTWKNEHVRAAHFSLSVLKSCSSPAVLEALRLPSPYVRARKVNSPKIAVCISGQLRSAQTNLPHIFSNIVEPLGADVFVHTWDKAQCTLPRFRHIHRFIGSKLTNDLPAHLRETPAFSARFPTTSRKLVTPIETIVTPSWIEKIIDVKKCVIETEQNFLDNRNISQSLKFARTFNQAKMFYKIKACDDLRKSHELECGFKYDAIIRIRPDLQIKIPELKSYVQDVIENRNRILVHYVDIMGAGDQFAIASPDAMEAYASIWDFLENHERWDYLPGFDNEPAEILVGNHLLAAGLQAQIVPASHNNLATDLAIAYHDLTSELEYDANNHGDPAEVQGFLSSYNSWYKDNFINAKESAK